MQPEQCKHLVFDAIPEDSRAFAYELLRRAVAFGGLRASSCRGELLKTSGHLARPFTFSFLDVSATSVLVRRGRNIETCGRRTPFNDYHLITRTTLGARACYELPPEASTAAALGSMRMAKTTKCKLAST